MESHKARVAAIASQIRSFHEQGRKFRIYHGSTNSTRAANLKRDAIVDTSGLAEVLSIDAQRRTALVEPNVHMDKLVETLLKADLMPPVVMEFPGITVGGGFSGTSGESSSFKYGLFEQTISSIEIVLADGEIVHASKDAHADLFYGAAGAFGTLGVVTLLEIELIPAYKYVELTYEPVSSISAAIAEISRAINDKSSPYSYIDAIIFSKSHAKIMLGRPMDAVSSASPPPVRTYDKPSDPWFALDAETLSQSQPTTTLIPTTSYLFRYDRGSFWAARYAFTYFLVPFTALTRRLLDRMLHTRTIYRAVHRSALSEQYLAQDVVLPFSSAAAFIDWTVSHFGIFPLWLCPLRKRQPGRADHGHLSAIRDPEGDEQEFVINVGIWGGYRMPSYAQFLSVNREIEAKISELGGVKTLYAQAFYTEEEFAKLYDVERWEALRRKYRAQGLPSVWEKVVTKTKVEDLDWKRRAKALWPVGGVYGILCMMMGDDGMFEREKSWVWEGMLAFATGWAAIYVARNLGLA